MKLIQPKIVSIIDTNIVVTKKIIDNEVHLEVESKNFKENSIYNNPIRR